MDRKWNITAEGIGDRGYAHRLEIALGNVGAASVKLTSELVPAELKPFDADRVFELGEADFPEFSNVVTSLEGEKLASAGELWGFVMGLGRPYARINYGEVVLAIEDGRLTNLPNVDPRIIDTLITLANEITEGIRPAPEPVVSGE